MVRSKPASVSAEYSGRRVAFPSAPSVTPGWSAVPEMVVANGEKKRRASVVPGIWPEAPYVARRRRVLSQL